MYPSEKYFKAETFAKPHNLSAGERS